MSLHFLIEIAPYVIYFLGIIVIFICFFKVEWGILFLIPLFPLQTTLDKIQQFPIGKDVNDILIIAMIIGWIIKTITRKGKFFEGAALNVPVMIMVFYTLFSLYYGSSYLGYPVTFDIYDVRIQTWKNYILLPIIYFIVLNNINEKKYIKWLALIMIGVIFIMSLQFFRSYRFVDKSVFSDAMRQTGTFSYLGPNEYAAFFSHYIFIVLGLLLLVKSKIKKIFLLATSALNLYCIVFLFSRGSYLATYAVLTLMGVLRKNILIIIFVMAILFSWKTLFPPSVVERVLMTKNNYGELEESAQLRVMVWNQSMALFASSPLIGVGFNTFPYLGFVLGETHNLYVKILVEQGVVGLIIFFVIIFFALVYGWRLYRKAKDDFLKGLGLGFVMCILSLLISNFFGDRWTYLPLGAYFWAFMGLVVRANIITAEEIRVSAKPLRC